MLNTLEVLKHILGVLHSVSFSRRNPYNEANFIRALISRNHLNHGAIGEHAAIIFLTLSEPAVVYNSAVGGRVLQHDDAITSQIDAEMRVRHPLRFVIGRQQYIAAGSVESETKPYPKVVHF